MEKKNYNEYTEDELKELQRKEALSDSEEYDDISDDTYNDGPVIRQFVENEKIAGGAALDDDDDLLSSGTACDNQGSNMIDDLPDIDLISDPEDNTDPDPISDPEDTQNQETEPNPEVVDAEDPISADKPGFQNESLIDEQERDYCDRESALQPMEEPELPDTKSSKKQKEKKPIKINPAIIIISTIALTLVMCVLLYISIVNFVGKDQKMTNDKESYLDVVSLIGSSIQNENSVASDLQKYTENLVLGVTQKDQYLIDIKDLNDRIQDQIESIGDISTSNIYENNIKIAALDYIRNTENIINAVIAACNEDANIDEIKEFVLYNIEDSFDTRDVLYNNLETLVLAEAKNLGIDGETDVNKLLFDIQKQ